MKLLKIALSLLLLPVLAACAGGQAATPRASAPPASLDGAVVTASGQFEGRSGHVTSGTAEVVRAADGWYVRLGPDFSLDGGPDPKVSFGSGEAWDAASNMGLLRSLTGEQAYKVPAGIDVGDYLHVYVWCEEFDVPLGVARLDLL